MKSLSVNGQQIGLDEQGYLANLSDWNEAVALALACEADIELGSDHWEIIWLIREFYQTFELAPAMRPLVKFIRSRLGEQKGSSLHLLTLFPGSPAKLCAKIAGLPKPDHCL